MSDMVSFRKQINYRYFQKLLKTGWQSWSASPNSLLRLPIFNFLPSRKNLTSRPHKNILGTLKKPSYGWCSWYSHGENIDENKILCQTEWIAKNKFSQKLPLEYVLIDGGWTIWGDWLEADSEKFPSGLKETAQKIKAYDLKPGIWMAPFLVHPRSKIAISHPDWLVKKNGQLVEGFRFTSFDRFFSHRRWILDVKNTQVKKYLDDSIKFLIDTCGFDLLKLDFLYGVHFIPSLSASEADKFLRSYLKKIKMKYPHVYTIACGCPLLPAAGVVDSMRIGPDTSISPFVKFLSHPIFSRWYLDHQVLPTVLKRLWTKRIWNVDPDAFMCHKTLGYTHQQLKKFQRIIRAGRGNIFLGDDLTRLPSERIKKYLHPLFN